MRASAAVKVLFRLLAIGLIAGIWGVSCNEPLDFDREEVERGSFGYEVHRILHKDLARSPLNATVRGDAFYAERDRFAGAVDTTVPDEMLDRLDALFVRMMPLYDSELVPGLLRKLAVVLYEAQGDPVLLEALARLSARQDTLQNPGQDRLLEHAFQFERMREVNQLLSSLLLAHDGIPEPGFSESSATVQLLLALSIEMREAELSNDPERFAVTLIDLLTTEAPEFAPSPGYPPLIAVRLDPRGLPSVAREASGLPYPFVDTDGDGFADVDQRERFVASGMDSLIAFGTPNETVGTMVRDDLGRLRSLSTEGGFAFEYIDLQQTVLGQLVRDSKTLLEADVPFDLLKAFQTALGDPTLYNDTYGPYDGYSRQSDLVGVAAGLLRALDHNDIPAVLEGASLLLRDHPDDLAEVLFAIDHASEIIDAHPDTDYDDDSTLLDDMLPLMLEMVETPGLMADVLESFSEPVAQEAGPIMGYLMGVKNDFISIDPNGAYQQCFDACIDTTLNPANEMGTLPRMRCIQGCPNHEIFAGFVNHDAPGAPDNVSLFQRIQALMWETAGTPYDVGIQELYVNGADFSNTAQSLGPVLQFDDLAEFYLLTMTRSAALEDSINPQVASLGSPLGLSGASVVEIVLWINSNILGIEMDPYPTTAQVTRFFNKNPLESDNPEIEMSMNMSICRSGYRCIDAHADTLLAIEASGLADAIYPTVAAFTAHGKTDLMARLFAVLYRHYPSKGVSYLDPTGAPLPFERSNIRALEPILIDILEDRTLLDSLGNLGEVTGTVTLDDGSMFTDALERLLRYTLTPVEGLALVDGSTGTFDLAGNRISPLSPFYLIWTPVRSLDTVLEQDPAAEQALDDAIEALADLMLDTVHDGTAAHFAKPASPVLARLVVDTLRDEWLKKDRSGERSHWLLETLPGDVADLMAGRALRSAVELYEWLEAEDGALGLLHDVSIYAVAQDESPGTNLTVFTYILLSLMLDEPTAVAFGHFFGPILDPSRVWEVEGYPETPLATHGIQMLGETADLDEDSTLLEVLSNGFAPYPDGTTRLGELWRIARQVNRVEPGSQEPLTSQDYQELIGITADFLLDDERGAERLYGFIELAMYGQEGKP